MQSELKPCPFCGSDRLMVLPPTCDRDTPYSAADRAYPVVRCSGCYTDVPGRDFDASSKSAVEAWNRRSALVDVPAVEPGEWHRSDGTMGSTLLYTLREDGWMRGKPKLVNDVTVRVERANGSMTDIEPIVRLIHATLAATRSGSATTASGTSAIRQRGESE